MSRRRRLRSEVHTDAVYHEVREAFYDSEHHRDGHQYRPFFEHGQWWVEDLDTGAQWSVVDARSGGRDYFDFEQVSEGSDW